VRADAVVVALADRRTIGLPSLWRLRAQSRVAIMERLQGGKKAKHHL